MPNRLAALTLGALLTLPASPAFAGGAPPVQEPAAGAHPKPLYEEGRMLLLVAPTFPKEALAAGRTASVEVYATIKTDGRLEDVRIEANPPDEAFESAVMDVVPGWRMQPRLATPYCSAYDTAGHVTLWFEIADGKPKVSFGAHVPVGAKPTGIVSDRKPVDMVAPLYPARLAADPRTPRNILQVAYVAVADDGSVTGVTLAPMLYYRDFEPFVVAAARQWKFAPADGPWCGEIQLNMTLH